MDTTKIRGHHLHRRSDGRLERYCTECHSWKSTREFNRRIAVGKVDGPAMAWHWFHLCRDCRAHKYDRVKHGDISGLIPVDQVWWIYDELARRVGMLDAAELSGMSYDNLRRLLYRRSRHVQRRRVREAIELLRELREEDVWVAPTTGRPPGYSRSGTQPARLEL